LKATADLLSELEKLTASDELSFADRSLFAEILAQYQQLSAQLVQFKQGMVAH
jgi:hypothetical protein